MWFNRVKVRIRATLTKAARGRPARGSAAAASDAPAPSSAPRRVILPVGMCIVTLARRVVSDTIDGITDTFCIGACSSALVGSPRLRLPSSSSCSVNEGAVGLMCGSRHDLGDRP